MRPKAASSALLGDARHSARSCASSRCSRDEACVAHREPPCPSYTPKKAGAGGVRPTGGAPSLRGFGPSEPILDSKPRARAASSSAFRSPTLVCRSSFGCCLCSPDEGGHQRASEVIRGHSEVIRGHQRSSEVIRGHQRSSEAIRGHQRPSEVIRGHQRSPEVIRGHQRSSEAIRGHQRGTR
jgi:hypothetical protein